MHVAEACLEGGDRETRVRGRRGVLGSQLGGEADRGIEGGDRGLLVDGRTIGGEIAYSLAPLRQLERAQTERVERRLERIGWVAVQARDLCKEPVAARLVLPLTEGS